VGRLAGVVVLAAVIAFCVAQDRGTSAGVGRYIAAQRAAPVEGRAGRGPTVTIDEVMGPANREAVREGMRWSGRVAMMGLIGALVFRRVRLKADTTRSLQKADTMRSRRG
jgi:hypothetical protein